MQWIKFNNFGMYLKLSIIGFNCNAKHYERWTWCNSMSKLKKYIAIILVFARSHFSCWLKQQETNNKHFVSLQKSDSIAILLSLHKTMLWLCIVIVVKFSYAVVYCWISLNSCTMSFRCVGYSEKENITLITNLTMSSTATVLRVTDFNEVGNIKVMILRCPSG